MIDLVNFSCPTCGNKLYSSNTVNQLSCESCGNEFFAKQNGNSISLVPTTLDDSAMVVGDSNVVVQINSPNPDNQTRRNLDSSSESNPDLEKVECPVCGKYISLTETFRCKKCQRQHICNEHQNMATYFCAECLKEVKKVKRLETSKIWGGLFVFLGIALFVMDVSLLFSDWYAFSDGSALFMLTGFVLIYFGTPAFMKKKSLSIWAIILLMIYSGVNFIFRAPLFDLMDHFW